MPPQAKTEAQKTALKFFSWKDARDHISMDNRRTLHDRLRDRDQARLRATPIGESIALLKRDDDPGRKFDAIRMHDNTFIIAEGTETIFQPEDELLDSWIVRAPQGAETKVERRREIKKRQIESIEAEKEALVIAKRRRHTRLQQDWDKIMGDDLPDSRAKMEQFLAAAEAL